MAAQAAYRRSLLWLLLSTAVLLVGAQLAVVTLGLSPLRRLAAQIGKLELGDIDCLEDDYPPDLRALTRNVNGLLSSEKQRRERVRSTMDRLTHVLKSPLMLIRNSQESGEAFRGLVDEQVSRMLGVVESELARAKLDGRVADILGKPVIAKPVLERIAAAYSRLPRPIQSGAVAVSIDTTGVDDSAIFYGDERDLQDLFGSLLENSLKFCHRHIKVSAAMEDSSDLCCFVLSIEDDGEGVPQGLEREILRRGARADSASTGQGLGLAIVVEIVSAYHGSLDTDRSSLGGALFRVSLPVPQRAL